MKTKITYRMLSLAMVFILTFLSVDVSVFAANGVEDVVEIQQEIPEEMITAENAEILENGKVTESRPETESSAENEEVLESQPDFETEDSAENEEELEGTPEIEIESSGKNEVILEGEPESETEIKTENEEVLEGDTETDSIAADEVNEEVMESVTEFVETTEVIEDDIWSEDSVSFNSESAEDEICPQWIALDVEQPVSNIKSGSKIAEETIIRLVSGTLDAKIYYTTDGTEPLAEDGSPVGNLYIDGIKAGKVMMDARQEAVEKVVIIKAYAVKEGNNNSQVVTFEYTVENEKSRWGEILEADRKLYATLDMPEGDASLVPKGMWIAGIKEEGYTYTGSSIMFLPDTENEIRVYDGKTLLKLNRDYTISYKIIRKYMN